MSKKEGLLSKMTREHEVNRRKPLAIKNPVYIFDPPEIAELRRELQHHPEMVNRLGSNQDDLPTIIGILAAEVDIVMDGHYTESDLCKVADMIINRLRDKRGAVLIVRSTT